MQKETSDWSFGKKFFFRFSCLFFPLLIFFLPGPGLIPFLGGFDNPYMEPLYRKLIKQLGIADTINPYTMGLLFAVVLALLGMLVWTVLDKKRSNYNQLYYWLTVVVRYYLAFTMISYGLAKVIKTQFPFPDPEDLLRPVGDLSPMGLVWTFMGYSEGYNIFTGAAEVLGGLLLFFRRTTLLGAIVTLVVMINVVAMNYFFDIPVKLFSSMLTVMLFFLIAKDMRRMYCFFVLNKPVPPSYISAPDIRKKLPRLALHVTKGLLIIYAVGFMVHREAGLLSKYDGAPRAPLYGIYDVETFVRNRDTLPPLQTDEFRWKQLIVGGSASRPNAHIKGMNDVVSKYAFTLDTASMAVEMFPYADSTVKNHLVYRLLDKEHLEIKGKWNGDSILVNMKMYDLNKFSLVKGGFHW
jgi:uncharacterized membrane protein YphA (DoxX/SURF4 family)